MLSRQLGGIVLLGTGLITTSAQGAGLDISLSNETANIMYLTDSGSLGYGGADIGIGVFYNENSDVILNGQILVTGKPIGDKKGGFQYGVGGKVFVAPDITSFGDTEGLTEFTFRVELEVMPSTRGYVGYRRLEPELTEAGDVKLDDEVHIGIRINF